LCQHSWLFVWRLFFFFTRYCTGAGDDGVDDGRVDDDGDDASLAGEDIGAAADDYE